MAVPEASTMLKYGSLAISLQKIPWRAACGQDKLEIPGLIGLFGGEI